MSPNSPQTILSKLADEGRFLRQWVGNPRDIGAIAPSSAALAEKMASFIPTGSTGPVVELGPGTGIVTQAILDHGVSAQRLSPVEYCSDFAALLGERFPNLNVVSGDAFALNQLPLAAEPWSAIVSSLPLISSPPEKRRQLILDGLNRLEPGAPFIQFSYAFIPPVRPEPGQFTVEKTSWIWANMPPARVWVYRRSM